MTWESVQGEQVSQRREERRERPLPGACFLLMRRSGLTGFDVAAGKHAPEKAKCQCWEAFPLERVKLGGHCVFPLNQAGEREVYVSL